jgi:hypothetical protein
MANYTLHLGFDWNSPLIGSIWKPDALTESYRFLQYALADNKGAPAWFQFYQGDTFSVIVWDLSSSPVSVNLTLEMAISETDAAETYNPTEYLTLTNVASVQKSGQYYLSFPNPSGPQSSTLQGPWGTSTAWYSDAGLVTFKANNFTCKLSFRLSASPKSGGSDQVYLSDPEVIVGSAGGSH